MYCNYYGFREKPFNITPNPRFLYLSKNHKEAFAHLLYGINGHAGFIELSGEVGTGKTTVLRTILEQLDDESHRTALILNPCLSALELLRHINREFGIPHEGLENGALLEELNRFLLLENSAGKTIVLVIDEAQNLSPAVLEQIRLISNLETESDKLIQILLAGQPELNALLARAELRQLSQRIIVRYHLLPMDFEDSCSYIRHRLQIAGGGEWINFSAAAMKRIFTFAKGSPRLINIACDRALLIGYTEDSKEISAEIAVKAIRELKGSNRYPALQPKIVAVLLVTLLIAAILLQKLPGKIAAYQKVNTPPPVTASASASRNIPKADAPATEKQAVLNREPIKPLPALLQPQATRPPLESGTKEQHLPWQELPKGTYAAVDAVARLWKLPPPSLPEKKQNPPRLATLARQSGLSTLPITGRVGKLLGMDVPVIVEIELPGKHDLRYIALTGVNQDRITIAPPLDGRSEIPRKELEGVLTGRGFILWKNHQNIPVHLAANSAAIEVIRLQILLIGTGHFKAEPSGVFDAATATALNQFSKKHRLKENAALDQAKLLLLYRDNSCFFTPRLGIKG